MRICFIPRNIDGAGWYRCFFPAHYLRERGHMAEAPAMGFSRNGQPLGLPAPGQLPDGWVDCHFGPWPDADIYVLQMPLDAQSPAMVRQLQRKGKKVVVELDDDYLHLPPYNPFKGDPQHLHKCVRLADAVTVSTPSLRSAYRIANKKITVLRNRLFWPMWENVVPAYEREWRRIRVGYMGILHYHSADLDVLKPWFGKWLAAHPEVEFVAAGDQRVHDHLGVPPSQRVGTDSVDFRHLELADVTAAFDIGLVPLARNKFNEGKSYLKGLEYSACGVVPCATPTQQYRELVSEGVDGYLCDSPKTWVRALDVLLGRATRERMGVAARTKARSFSYEHHVDEWETFYASLNHHAVASRTLWTAERVPAVG